MSASPGMFHGGGYVAVVVGSGDNGSGGDIRCDNVIWCSILLAR